MELVLDFLTERNQVVRSGKVTSKPQKQATPKGCVSYSLLFTHIEKLGDDTMVVGIISEGDKAPYRNEVNQLAAQCKNHNLVLNVRFERVLLNLM